VNDSTVALDAAHGVNSLRAVFGEKYPDNVRVVSIGPKVDALLAEPETSDWHQYSIELCGGTHVANTDEIGRFVLTHEEGVAKGVRRVVGITGAAARNAQEAARQLHLRLDGLEGSDPEVLATGLAVVEKELSELVVPLRERGAILNRTAQMREAVRRHEKEQAAEQGQEVADRAAELLETATQVGNSHIVVGEVPSAPPEKLREAVDWLRQKAGSAAVLLFSPADGKITLLAGLTDDLVARGLDAKLILREAGKIVGGGGGGRPDLAQGGGKDPEKIDEATAHVREWLAGQLG
jgi:alanyl-tRNA synthetase